MLLDFIKRESNPKHSFMMKRKANGRRFFKGVIRREKEEKSRRKERFTRRQVPLGFLLTPTATPERASERLIAISISARYFFPSEGMKF